MAVVSVSAQNTRVNTAESTTGWLSSGGGSGGGLETDFVFQGSNCFARKGTTSARSIGLSAAANHNMSVGSGTYQTWMVKYICTTPGLLDPISTPGMKLELGSGTTTSRSTNRYDYHVQGNDTYPVDRSWLVLPIDPNVASHRDAQAGSPSLTAVDWFGLTYDQSGTSKSPNQALDAVDIGDGLTLIGGDTEPKGAWQDFSDYDWGTSGNRFGYVREVEGIFLIYGTMRIGTASLAFFEDDTRSTLVFPDGRFAAGWTGVWADLQNGGTEVLFRETTFISKGTASGEDTRAVFTFTGTSGVGQVDQCSFQNFADITFTSVCQTTNSTLETETLNQAGSNIANCKIFTTSPGSVATIQDPDFTALSNIDFFAIGAGHAIEIDTAGTYGLDNLTFTDYGANTSDAAAIDVTASTGTVTLNILNGGGTPTYKTAGATVIVQNTVAVTITVRDVVDRSVLAGAFVHVEADDGGALPSGVGAGSGTPLTLASLTRTGTTASAVTSATHGYSTSDQILILGADQPEYNGIHTITVTSTVTFTYTVSVNAVTPSTGTRTSRYPPTITRSGSTATVTHVGHALTTGDQVTIRGADQTEYNITATVTVTGADTFTYTVAGSPTTPATGIIGVHFVVIHEDTNGSGIANNTGFSFLSNQPIVGVVRQGDVTPYYKEGVIAGTITSAGYETTILLVRDS